ncbi:hypothetical protein Tco_1269802 [Tanacetum coccineum]
MDPYNHTTNTSTKLPILDTGKFEQWKFRIQQYLQHEHYALWEVIEFGDSYKVPPEEPGKAVAGEASAKKKGRTVAITTEDMQKRRNDVKARTTLLLALPDEHQLRFSKYDNAKELWEAILKTFGGNEATKKTKKNQLKQQYGNFKAEGSETLEQTFNRLQAIVSHLEFMDVPIEKDDLNQKFLTSLAPEWLMYTIVWRNRDDLDTMSLDDLYNHLKVYEPEVQKKAGSNSQNMAFISSSNTSSGKGEVPTASVPTASSQVSTVSTEVAAASLSHDTICAYIATQSSGSQIKYEDITQIDEDDIEEIDIKWNLALLSIRANSYMANEDENRALVADDVVPTEFALMAMSSSSSSSDNEVYDDSYCSKSCRKNTENLNTKINKLNEELGDCETDLYNYKRCLSQVKTRLVEFKVNETKFCERIKVLERDVEIRDNKIESLRNELEELKKEKESIDHKFAGFGNALKDVNDLLESQKSVKDKTGVGFNEYSDIPRFLHKSIHLLRKICLGWVCLSLLMMLLLIIVDKLKEVYQIFRVGQAPKAYPYFKAMLKEFDRDDMVTLWKLVKDRFKEELPKSDLEKCLFWPLKVMFEPLATDGMIIYMLDDVEYPLSKTTLQKMLDHKCEVNEVSSLGEDCWEQNAKAFPLLVIWFPLLEIFPIVSVSLPLPRFPLLEDFPLLIEDKDYSDSKMRIVMFRMCFCVYPIYLEDLVRYYHVQDSLDYKRSP